MSVGPRSSWFDQDERRIRDASTIVIETSADAMKYDAISVIAVELVVRGGT